MPAAIAFDGHGAAHGDAFAAQPGQRRRPDALHDDAAPLHQPGGLGVVAPDALEVAELLLADQVVGDEVDLLDRRDCRCPRTSSPSAASIGERRLDHAEAGVAHDGDPAGKALVEEPGPAVGLVIRHFGAGASR